MAAAVEQTYIMIKPDGVQRGLVSGHLCWHAGFLI
jgi:nucleoside diphosphate kinase